MKAIVEKETNKALVQIGRRAYWLSTDLLEIIGVSSIAMYRRFERDVANNHPDFFCVELPSDGREKGLKRIHEIFEEGNLVFDFIPSREILTDPKYKLCSKESIAKYCKEGFYLTEEGFEQMMIFKKAIILDSDEEKLQQNAAFGSELEIMSLTASKISFESINKRENMGKYPMKDHYGYSDFISLINQGRLKLTIVL